MASDTDDAPTGRLESRKPALVSYEKVMELHGKLELIQQELKGLGRLVNTVADLERRVLTQELSVPAGALITLQGKVHELELKAARSETTGSTWKEALTWLNTALLLFFGAIGAYFALRPHA